MQKPIIYFNPVQYKVGDLVGWRPSLETAVKICDLDLAEEIVLENRMSMSPAELLYAIKMTLTTCPKLLSADGRTREFSDLLSWTRTASGKLADKYGAWNDTCRANIRVKLLKNSKGVVAGDFYNSETVPYPSISNILYPGAQLAQYAIWQGRSIDVYGRNLQFVNGTDEAKLIVGTTEYPLFCTGSSINAAEFNWPTGLTCEVGSVIKLYFSGRGGTPDASQTVIVRDVRVVGADSSATITSFYGGGDPEGAGSVYPESELKVTGTGLTQQTGDVWTLECDHEGTHYVNDITSDLTSVSSSGTTVTFDTVGCHLPGGSGDWAYFLEAQTGTLNLKRGGSTVSVVCEFRVV